LLWLLVHHDLPHAFVVAGLSPYKPFSAPFIAKSRACSAMLAIWFDPSNG
jgi:hypothetical protein